MFFGLFKKKWPMDEFGFRIPRESRLNKSDRVMVDTGHSGYGICTVNYVAKFSHDIEIISDDGRKSIINEDRLTLVGRL